MPSVYACPCNGEKRIVAKTQLLSSVATELYPVCRIPTVHKGTEDWVIEIVLRCDELGSFKRLPRNPHIQWIKGDAVIEKFISNEETGDCEKAPITSADLKDIDKGLKRLSKIYFID